MTKEITKAIILQEIQDKFGLREFDPANFLFDETVLPTYDVTSHLIHEQTEMVAKSITATGGIPFFIVPSTERWFLNRYTVVPMGVGAYTFAGVYLTRGLATSTFIYLDLTAAQTVSYTNDLPKPVMLEPSDRLYINIDGYTSVQDLRLYIDYGREIIR